MLLANGALAHRAKPNENAVDDKTRPFLREAYLVTTLSSAHL